MTKAVTVAFWILMGVMLAPGCDRVAETEGTDPDEDTGADTDVDSDSDSDGDSDGDTDDLPPEEDCYQGSIVTNIETTSQLEELATYPCITGDLNLSIWVSGEVVLPNLVWIGGYMMLQDSEVHEGIRMPALRLIGQKLEVVGLFELQILDLGSLESIGGEFWISDGDSLTDLDLTSLESVGGRLEVWHNSQISDLDWLDGLTSVGDDIRFNHNTELPCCEICDLLEQLVLFEDDVEVEGNLTDGCCPFGELMCP